MDGSERQRDLPGEFVVGVAERELPDAVRVADVPDGGDVVRISERDECNRRLGLGEQRSHVDGAGGDGIDAEYAERDNQRTDGHELQLYDGRLDFQLWQLGAIPVQLGRQHELRLVSGGNDQRFAFLVVCGHVFGDGPRREPPGWGFGARVDRRQLLQFFRKLLFGMASDNVQDVEGISLAHTWSSSNLIAWR